MITVKQNSGTNLRNLPYSCCMLCSSLYWFEVYTGLWTHNNLYNKNNQRQHSKFIYINKITFRNPIRCENPTESIEIECSPLDAYISIKINLNEEQKLCMVLAPSCLHMTAVDVQYYWYCTKINLMQWRKCVFHIPIFNRIFAMWSEIIQKTKSKVDENFQQK